MISAQTRDQMRNVERDLSTVVNNQSFGRIRSNSSLLNPWNEAKDLALRWIARVGVVPSVDDPPIQPLLGFARRIVEIGAGQQPTQGDIPGAILNARQTFQAALPVMAYELLEASGITNLSREALEGWRDTAVSDVDEKVKQEQKRIENVVAELIANIRSEAEQAVKDFDFAKAEASKISVDAAERQFKAAEAELGKKSKLWAA